MRASGLRLCTTTTSRCEYIMPRRKLLKSVASGFLGSFLSRNNDFDGYWALGLLYQLALDRETRSMTIELFRDRDKSLPRHALIDDVSTRYRAQFISMLEKAGFNQGDVVSVIIELEFCTAKQIPFRHLKTHGELLFCSVTITDEQRHAWRVEGGGKCAPHDPAKESRSTRSPEVRARLGLDS